MKSKNKKIQILKKGISMAIVLMLAVMPVMHATAAVGGGYLVGSLINRIIYGTIGSTAIEIETYFAENTTLYIINETHLRAFAEYVNKGNNCEGKIISLLNDIHLDQNKDWTPIGSTTNKFQGRFCGEGHTIYNLTNEKVEHGIINTETGDVEKELVEFGFFGSIGEKGFVDNLGIEDSNIQIEMADLAEKEVPYAYIGKIAGSNYGTIEFCWSDTKFDFEKGTTGKKLGEDDEIEPNIIYGTIVGYNDGILVYHKDIEKEVYGILSYNAIEHNKVREYNLLNKLWFVQQEIVLNGKSAPISIKMSKILSDGETIEDLNPLNSVNFIKYGETANIDLKIKGRLSVGVMDGSIKLLQDIAEDLEKYYPGLKCGDYYFTPISAEEITEDGNIYTLIKYSSKNEVNDQQHTGYITLEWENGRYIYYCEEDEEFNIENQLKNTTTIFPFFSVDSRLPGVTAEAYVEEEGMPTPTVEGRYIEGTKIYIKVTTNEKVEATKAPKIRIFFSDSGSADYNYQNNKILLEDARIDEEGKTSWIYSYTIEQGDDGVLYVEYLDGLLKDMAEHERNINELEPVKLADINVDTEAPRAIITNNVGSVTNKNKIIYTIEFCEKVSGFEVEDIKLSGGTITKFLKFGDIDADGLVTKDDKEALSQYIENKGEYKEEYDLYMDGKLDEIDVKVLDEYEPILDQTTKFNRTYWVFVDVNESDLTLKDVKLTIEKGVCRNLRGFDNVRSENVVAIDKKEPTLIDLQVTTKTAINYNNIQGDTTICREGDIITITATFDENIANCSNSEVRFLFGNGKAALIDSPLVVGNKVIYTYIVTAEDEGTLLIKKLAAKVTDLAGNDANIEKQNLGGYKIVVDNTPLSLVKLTAVAPSFAHKKLSEIKTYGNSSIITIIAEYNEDIYTLYNSTDLYKGQYEYSIPSLKLKFGEGDERLATFEKVEGNKIYYTYNIQTTDNGDFSIVSMVKEDEMYNMADLSGTIYTIDAESELPELETYQEKINEENKLEKITADTIIPEITTEFKVIGSEKDKKVYGKNTTITITAESNEYIYKNNGTDLVEFTKETAPALNIRFNESGNAKGVVICTGVEYKDNKTIFTYSYTVINGDEGLIDYSIESVNGYDIANNIVNNILPKAQEKVRVDAVAPIAYITYEKDSERNVMISKISFGSETGVIITNNNGQATHTFSENGEFTYTFRDSLGNEGEATAVVKELVVIEPEIVFENISTIQINGVKYLRVSPSMNKDDITAKMDKKALNGKTPEYKNLTEDGKLKTGTEIALKGETKYTIIVKGDVNSDGSIDLNDAIRMLQHRAGGSNPKLTGAGLLAAQLSEEGTVTLNDVIKVMKYKANNGNVENF